MGDYNYAETYSELMGNPKLSQAEFNRWRAGKTTNTGDDIGPAYYQDYLDCYELNTTYSPGDSDLAHPGTTGGSLIYNLSSEASNIWKNFPAYDQLVDFLKWYFPESKDTILRQRTPFPFDITISTPEMETELLDLMRTRVEAGRGLTAPPTDLAKAWEKAYASRLPSLEAAQKEERATEREQLDALGFGAETTVGSTAAKEMADKFAISKELLRFESDTGLAQAKEADWARLNAFELQENQMADADIQNLFSMLARPEERERRNIEAKIAEEQNIRGLPAMVSLGVPTANTAMQGASTAYTGALGAVSSLNSAAAGLAASKNSAAASMYNTDAGIAFSKWEADFMAPYLQEAMSGGGGAKK